MKTIAAQTMHGVLVALSILLTMGCGDRQTSSTQPTQTVNTKPDPAIKILEAKVGMAFPTNAVLVNSGDGGGRDPGYGYYMWAVFSPSPLTMPPMQATGVKDYLNLPLEDTAKSVQADMQKRKITQPQLALGSEWETNGYTFRARLIRSPQGDHLLIEQFRKK